MDARTSAGAGSVSASSSAWTRRRWIAASLVGGGGIFLGHRAVIADDSADPLAQVQELARKAGLGRFRSSTSEHYVGIGDAPDAYRQAALERCEALAKAYLDHFQEKGFAVAAPKHRLAVVTLKDKASYQAFLGERPAAAVGGHFDLESDWLVIFDFRPGGDLPQNVNLERINKFTLIHEATHQLTFNTGLLELKGDVPVAVSEGLAMYAEPRLGRADRVPVLGVVNGPRLKVLVDRAKRNEEEIWIPVERLLTDDALFDKDQTRPLADAGAWVLVHYFLKTAPVRPKFRDYLEAIRPRRDASQRLADAQAQLGDLERLNGTLRKYAKRLIQGG